MKLAYVNSVVVLIMCWLLVTAANSLADKPTFKIDKNAKPCVTYVSISGDKEHKVTIYLDVIRKDVKKRYKMDHEPVVIVRGTRFILRNADNSQPNL